jgi:hypothetical protein
MQKKATERVQSGGKDLLFLAYRNLWLACSSSVAGQGVVLGASGELAGGAGAK